MNGPGADARYARDEGIGRAADHANRVTPAWVDLAFDVLADYLTKPPHCTRGFTAEDVREYAHGSCGIPEPPSLRSWGAVFQRAAREGLIARAGVTEARAARVHCSIISVWSAV